METIIQTARDVHKFLPHSCHYNESNYHKAFAHLLQKNLPLYYSVSMEVPIPCQLPDGFVFGYGRADVVVESKDHVYIIELKVSHSDKRGPCGMHQLRRYMYHYQTTKKKRSLLVNFGRTLYMEIDNTPLKDKTITERKNRKTFKTPDSEFAFV